jgi:hypothetical protein
MTSKFYIYTTQPIQEFEQDVTKYITTIQELSKNKYDNILIIIGGSLWDHKQNYDSICNDIRLSLQKYKKGNNLIINIDGNNDKFEIKESLNNTYIHLKIFLSYDLNCPFNIELFKFIDKYLEENTKIYLINSVFEYGIVIKCENQISNIFKKYKNYTNFNLLNFVNFPTTELYTKYQCLLIISNLQVNNNYEFTIWKKIYKSMYKTNYRDDIKSNNLKTITYNDFIYYCFNSI